MRHSLAIRSCAALLGIFAIASNAAFAHTLHVPFFTDDGGALDETGPLGGSAAFISIKNNTNGPITMYVVYQQPDLNGDVVVQEAEPFTLGSREGISWRPVKEFSEEGAGINVPDIILGFSDSGAAEIIWLQADGDSTALQGRYTEYTRRTAFAHVLLSE